LTAIIITLNLSYNTQIIIALAIILAFSVKIPVIPIHTWLPETHVEAPTSASVILAGLLLKFKGGGILHPREYTVRMESIQ
jgi:NADH:ubiquinone oxidoreductase subunit 4 (subunit M)